MYTENRKINKTARTLHRKVYACPRCFPFMIIFLSMVKGETMLSFQLVRHCNRSLLAAYIAALFCVTSVKNASQIKCAILLSLFCFNYMKNIGRKVDLILFIDSKQAWFNSLSLSGVHHWTLSQNWYPCFSNCSLSLSDLFLSNRSHFTATSNAFIVCFFESIILSAISRQLLIPSLG